MSSALTLRSQKITMLIEVVPGPRLDVVSEGRHAIPGTTEVGSPVDDRLSSEAVNNTTADIEIHASSLAFDVTSEDLFLLDSESMESLLSGVPKTVIVNLLAHSPNATSDSKYDADQQNHTKIRLTFIPVFKKPQLVHDGIGREENSRHDDTDCDTISERLFKKLKKCLHEAIKAHRR